MCGTLGATAWVPEPIPSPHSGQRHCHHPAWWLGASGFPTTWRLGGELLPVPYPLSHGALVTSLSFPVRQGELPRHPLLCPLPPLRPAGREEWTH